MKKHVIISAIAAAAFVASPAMAQKQKFYKFSSIALSTPYVVNTTFAKIIQKHNPDIKLQINATGIAPRHALDVATGKVHFYMATPALHHLMSKGLAMYKKNKKAPELSKNLRAMFNYRIGFYQAVVYADSGIKTLADVKGKKVFLGPPAAVARIVARDITRAVTGLQPGKDYTVVKLGFGAARQAFQDRQFDVLWQPSNAPSAAVAQLALSNKIRILSLTDADWKKPAMIKLLKFPGRTKAGFSKDIYGKNQVNETDVQTPAAWVGLGTHKNLPDEIIYRMTKTFWENIDEMHKATPWAKDAIKIETAFEQINMKLHPGSVRYYKEKGIKIPAVAMP